MAAFNFDFTELTFTNLKNEVDVFLQKTYKKAGQVFSAASPYGHILQAVDMIFQLLMTYLKNTVNQFDLSAPNNVNARTIRTLAMIGGHDPVRGQSATGTLRLQVRPTITISEEIGGSKITFLNRTRIRNKTNNLDYYLDLGVNSISFIIAPGVDFYLPVTQGLNKTQIFTGLGEKNQSLSIVAPSIQEVEQNRIVVRVNSQVWSKREHLYDMLPNEDSYFVKTGFTGSAEIWFGNDNFGRTPEVGDKIEVNYVVTEGFAGNILNSVDNDFVFIDEVFDAFGNLVDIEKNFFIFIENEIGFGADAESIEFTKAIMPFVSRNFVLAKPEQFTFVLRRLNIFSQVNAYTTEKGSDFDNQDPLDDSIVYIFLVPDFTQFLKNNNTANYFTLNSDAFTLDNNEKNKIIQYLNAQGTIGVGIGVKIIQPVQSKYILNIVLFYFNDVSIKNVNEEILNSLSDYFVNLQRRDIIPKSDLIRVVENVDGVDSVSIGIISEKNEAYHREFEEFKESIMKSDPTADPDKIVMEDYDPKLVLGLDPVLNDIIITKDELILIRGGWKDRFGTFYDELPNNKS